MRKFIFNTFFFTLFCLVILFILNIVIHYKVHKNDYYSFQYDEIFHPKKNADNIIIGTSHGTHGIQPAILDEPGNTFFNFALNGANPEYYLNWYQKIFKPNYKKPKYMVIVLDWFLFNEKLLKRHFEQDAEFFSSGVFLNALFGNNNYNKTMLIENRFPVLKYRDKILHEIVKHDYNTFPVSKYKDGFMPFEIKMDVKEFYPDSQVLKKDWMMKFENMVSLVHEDGIKIIFVVAPTYNLDARVYADLPVYKYFDSLASVYSIPVLNYNRDKRSPINADKSLFVEGSHLNYSGSVAFSNLLKTDLEKIIR